MIFLIDYDRQAGRIVTMTEFKDSEKAAAQASRLELELRLHREKVDREIVLLEAEDEAAIRQSHGRYFYTVRELLDRLLHEIPLTAKGR